MFDIVLKFHDQNLSVVEVITIPIIILKRHTAYVLSDKLKIKGLDCVYVIKYFGHGVHFVHRAANLLKVLQLYLPEGVGPP